MILRRVARPLLALIFIAGGINALRSPQRHAEIAKPVVDKAVGENADLLPDAVPTDPETLVKIDVAVKVGAGTLFALGMFPRLSSVLLLGSLVPTTFAAHRFWEASDEGEKQQQLMHFLKNAGLAGGLLLAAADTEGKPSMGWRARHAAKLATDQLHDVSDSAWDTVHDAQTKAGKLAAKATKSLESALPG